MLLAKRRMGRGVDGWMGGWVDGRGAVAMGVGLSKRGDIRGAHMPPPP